MATNRPKDLPVYKSTQYTYTIQIDTIIDKHRKHWIEAKEGSTNAYKSRF